MSAPTSDAVAAIAARLRAGKWRFTMHARTQGGGLYVYTSNADPRVQAMKSVLRRGGSMTTYYFLTEAAPQVLKTIDDVARVVAAHDAAQERAAQPSE